MIIKRLTAAFGKLNNETLTLKPGLNIIKAPNESGKSTWCAFIRAMLYGIDTSERDRQGYLSDKTRYRPWSGAEMAGEMDITCRLGDVTIRRQTSGKAPMRGFKAVYTDTETQVEELTGENAAEFLTGVTEQVFRRSAFISQSGVKVEQTPELEKRVSALVSTGDEETSYTEADEKLREWLRRRKYNKRGEIPALETKISELDEKLEELESANEKLAVLRSDMKEVEREREMLTQELSYYTAREREEKREKAERAQRSLEAASAAEAELSSRLKEYGNMTPEELSGLKGEVSAISSLRDMLEKERVRAGAKETELSEIKKRLESSGLAKKDIAGTGKEFSALERSRKFYARMRIGFLVAFVLLWTAVFWLDRGVIRYLTIGAGALTIISLIVNVLLEIKCSRRIKTILSECGVKSAARFYEKINEYTALSDQLKRAQEAYFAAENVVRNAEAMYNDARVGFMRKLEPMSFKGSEPDEILKTLGDIEGVLRDYEKARGELSAAEKIYAALSPDGIPDGKPQEASGLKPRMGRERTAEELDRVKKRLELCRSQYNIALGEQRALGDPAVLRGKRNEAQSRLGELRAQYDALILALEALDKANVQMQTRFSPLLSKTAEGFLSKLTGGRYEKLVFDKSFNAAAKTPEDTVGRDALYLSSGTVDQVYLALRLAVSELVLPEKEKCPIILDDALSSFDDTRTKNAMRLLSEISERRQVILFTCHGREAALLPENAKANIVEDWMLNT